MRKVSVEVVEKKVFPLVNPVILSLAWRKTAILQPTQFEIVNFTCTSSSHTVDPVLDRILILN